MAEEQIISLSEYARTNIINLQLSLQYPRKKKISFTLKRETMKGNVQGVAIVWAIKKNRTLATLKTSILNCILKLDARLNTWSGGFEKYIDSHAGTYNFFLPDRDKLG